MNFTTSQASPITKNRLYELQLLDLDEWKEEEILTAVRTQFTYASNVYAPRKTLWKELIKLYLNQFRKRVSDIEVGSKLIFTQFHETYSLMDTDHRRVVFKERKPSDYEKVIYTNAVAKFDFEEMKMPSINRRLLWDVIFFGTGILDVSTYNTKKKLMELEIQSPFTFFLDPKAKSIDDARFAGRFIYKTFYELYNDSRIDSSVLKEIVLAPSGSTFSKELRQEKEAKAILLGDSYYEEPLMPSVLIEVLEWYFYNNGKLWVVWTNNAINKLLGFQKVDYQDGEDKTSKIPFILYNFYITPFSALGLGLPEIIDDNHRVDVVLKNFLLKSIILDATSSFLVNYEALLNRKDLMTKEIGKIIFTKVPPQGQIVPFPKTGALSPESLSFINIMQNEAVGAIGASKILRGTLTQVKKTATEVAQAKAKQDQLIASIVRNLIVSEKDFWYRWLKRHKRFLKKDDTKLIELIGYQGAREFVEVKKSDFIPETDPAIEVVSSLETEHEKILRRRELAEIVEPLAKLGGNVREVIKTILYDMDFSPEQVDIFLPPTPHELRAKLENEMLEDEEFVEIHENDDDIQHIAIHYKAKENEVRNLHIQGHILNYLRKQGLTPPEKEKAAEEISERLPSVETSEELGRLLTSLPAEGEKIIASATQPETPSEVK